MVLFIMPLCKGLVFIMSPLHNGLLFTIWQLFNPWDPVCNDTVQLVPVCNATVFLPLFDSPLFVN